MKDVMIKKNIKINKRYLIYWYNTTCTGTRAGTVETYQEWLERQLISRIKKLKAIEKII